MMPQVMSDGRGDLSNHSCIQTIMVAAEPNSRHFPRATSLSPPTDSAEHTPLSLSVGYNYTAIKLQL